MTDTVFHMPLQQIRVTHQSCATIDGLALDGLRLTAINCQPNTLSQISIGLHGQTRDIFIHWESFSSANELHLLYCEETQTLFVGGGTLSATIRLPAVTIIHENIQVLFWAFEWRHGFVLELGELDCYLYRSTGECVGHASVDPPYDIDERDNAINFRSIVAGSQWIDFPATKD